MSDTESEMAEAIAMLSHSQSAKRRADAKRLRKLGEPRAGEVLLLV